MCDTLTSAVVEPTRNEETLLSEKPTLGFSLGENTSDTGEFIIIIHMITYNIFYYMLLCIILIFIIPIIVVVLWLLLFLLLYLLLFIFNIG